MSQCGLRLEVERARLAVTPDFGVVLGAPPDRHRRVRQVGHGHQQIRALLLHRIELRFELLDLLSARLVRREDARRVEALLLRARDFLAGGVLFALQPFDLQNQFPALRVERAERPEDRLGIEAAVPESGPDLVGVVADERGIEHG